MITVGLSTLLSQYLRRYSIYTLRLYKTGVPIERDRDVDLMKSIQVCEVMTREPEAVQAGTRLANLADLFVRTRHHGFPVLDDRGDLLGIVTVQDLERIATAGGEMDQLSVADITVRDVVVVHPDDSLAEALEIMGDGNFGRLPVVERKTQLTWWGCCAGRILYVHTDMLYYIRWKPSIVPKIYGWARLLKWRYWKLRYLPGCQVLGSISVT
jgi:CIC family chloride channel protein